MSCLEGKQGIRHQHRGLEQGRGSPSCPEDTQGGAGPPAGKAQPLAEVDPELNSPIPRRLLPESPGPVGAGREMRSCGQW